MTMTLDSGKAERFDLVGLLAIAATGALISLCLTGHLFGIANNIFHLPILASLFDERQYADDAFIQSLRYFAAGPGSSCRDPKS